MLSPEYSIPISVDVDVADVLQGIFEIEGLLNYEDETLTIEYHTKELFSRGGRIESIDIDLDILREVVVKRGFVGTTIRLRPKRLTAFSDVPVASKGEIVLKVKRSHRKEAEELGAHLQRVMTFRTAPDPIRRIPFKCSDVGLREINGDIYLEDNEYLVLDVRNALVGEFDTQEHLIKVAPRALREIRLEQRRRRDRLIIRPKGYDLLDAMPGRHSGEIELKISRKYRDDVDRLIYEVTRLSLQEPSASTDEDDDDAPDSEQDSSSTERESTD